MQVLVLPWRYGQKKIGVEKGALSLLSMIIKKNTFDYKIINSNDKSHLLLMVLIVECPLVHPKF